VGGVIDPDRSPAALRDLTLPARWDEAGQDLSPGAARLAETIREHDRRFRAALASPGGRARSAHLLYDRWVRLDGTLAPISEAPFRTLAETCGALGWGLSAALALGGPSGDDDALAAIARWLTRIDVVLSPQTERRDSELVAIIDRLAQSPAMLTLCGDIDRFRAMGATTLPSLNRRPHAFRPPPRPPAPA
jgi:hypothetical protein